jgi:hypothetical protein
MNHVAQDTRRQAGPRHAQEHFALVGFNDEFGARLTFTWFVNREAIPAFDIYWHGLCTGWRAEFKRPARCEQHACPLLKGRSDSKVTPL